MKLSDICCCGARIADDCKCDRLRDMDFVLYLHNESSESQPCTVVVMKNRETDGSTYLLVDR